LASVGVDDVRDVINVGSAEVPDAKVLKIIKRSEVTLELETGKRIAFIMNYAPLYYVILGSGPNPLGD